MEINTIIQPGLEKLVLNYTQEKFTKSEEQSATTLTHTSLPTKTTMEQHQAATYESHPPISPNYSFIFPFENKFEHLNTRIWMINHWHTSFYAVGLYMILIFGGQAYMSTRPPFKLKRLLTLWNVTLALFSIFGFVRTFPELLHVLKSFGLPYSVCNSSFIEDVKPSAFWTWLFVLSKVPELVDTIFIVLRKNELIFLHWYHHITVLLFTWYTYQEYTASGRWFVNMNYFVHSMMYSYYALRSLGFRIPKQMAMAITTCQILQMIAGAYVIWYAYILKNQGYPCKIGHTSAILGLVMYLSYFILFARFFYQAYFARTAKAKKFENNGKTTLVKDVKKD